MKVGCPPSCRAPADLDEIEKAVERKLILCEMLDVRIRTSNSKRKYDVDFVGGLLAIRNNCKDLRLGMKQVLVITYSLLNASRFAVVQLK